MKRYITTLLVLISIILPGCRGLTVSAEHKEEDSPISKILLMEDPGSKLTIEEISGSKFIDKFQKSSTRIYNFGITDSTYWVKFELNPQIPLGETAILKAGSPIIEYLSLYIPREDGKYEEKKSGYSIPVKQRDLAQENFGFVFPVIYGKPYYISVKSRYSIQFWLKVWDQKQYMAHAWLNDVWKGLFLGILLAMILFNFIVFMYIRDNSFLFYVWFLMGVFLFLSSSSGMINLFFPYEVSFWLIQRLTLSAAIAISGWLLFMLYIINIRKRFPRWYRFLSLMLFFSAVLIILSFMAGMTFNLYYALFLVVITTAGNAVGLISAVKQGYRIALFIIIAYLPAIFGVLVSSLVFANVLNLTIFTDNILTIGFAISSILFSLGLAGQIHNFKLEREQYALQVENKNRELKHMHDKLLDLVEQRTSELNRSNQELEIKNRDLIAAKKLAESANRLKSEFLANMSHELRTPMHHILSYASLGLRNFEKRGDKIIKYLNNIKTAGERMVILLNNLLDLSKLETGELDLFLQNNDMLEIIRNKAVELELDFKNKEIRLIVEQPAFESLLVCDGVQVSHVIQNLFLNAIQYSEKGKRVVVSLEQVDLSSFKRKNKPLSGAGLKVSVRDHGIGIPESELELVFDKFFQGSRTKTGSGGTGLGLAISKGIVEAHGGTIWAENVEEGGTSFNFVLPYTAESV